MAEIIDMTGTSFLPAEDPKCATAQSLAQAFAIGADLHAATGTDVIAALGAIIATMWFGIPDDKFAKALGQIRTLALANRAQWERRATAEKGGLVS